MSNCENRVCRTRVDNNYLRARDIVAPLDMRRR